MIKRFLIGALVWLPMASFAAGNGANKMSGTTDRPPVAASSGPGPGTGNATANPTLRRSSKRALKAYCEAQAKERSLSGVKAKAAIAACEKS